MSSKYYHLLLPWLPTNKCWQTSPISFLWRFWKSKLDSWNQFLLSKFIIKIKRKNFCTLHVETSIFWSGRSLLRRKWLGFSSLRYLYKSKFDFIFFYWEWHSHTYVRFPKYTTSEKERLAHTRTIAHTKAIIATCLGWRLNFQLQTHCTSQDRDDTLCYWGQWNEIALSLRRIVLSRE